MDQNQRVKLRFGPYKTPRFKYGDVVFCERCGYVKICGLSKGRIPWPTCRRGKARAIILYGALADAVSRESAVAVQYWWGVGRDRLWKWRKTLEVKGLTPGTRALLSEHNSEPARIAILAKEWIKAGDPERRAKMSAARKGRVPPPHVMEAAHAANRGRKVSKETRRKMSEAHKRHPRKPPNGRAWTPEEDALFQSRRPREVAIKTGRTMESVWQRRRVLGYPDGRRTNGPIPRLGPWRPEEDGLFSTLAAKEIAARTGRTLNSVYLRRSQLRQKNFTLVDGRKNNGRPPRGN
jgi:hypothetical protein